MISRSRVRLFACAVAACIAAGGAGALRAQGLTGQISGTVMDSSRSLLPGATVQIRNVGTQRTRDVSSDDQGAFVFTELLAGTYDITVSLSGFKAYEQKGIALSANERVPLRPIVLEVGALQEVISVQAEAARVQSNSAERSGLITQQQLNDIALKGRDYMGMLKLVPGVIDTQNREAPGWNNINGLSINGGRTNTINLTYDGVTNLDTGSNTGPFLAPGLDSIAEIKVLTSNYQAEYGRSSGGTINVVTKSGTRTFRGGGFYARRDESFNANEWLNNKSGRPKPIYRFDYVGYHVGGPVLLPKFNSSRNKLFFFFNQEFLPRTEPGELARRTVPTALQRQGDFSQTFDTQGRLIPITDPLTGRPFPGNVIPANRIDPLGQAILNLYPAPNATDPAGQYNFTFQRNQFDHPRNDQVLRVDWNVGPKTSFYSRVNWSYEGFKGNHFLSNDNIPQFPIAYEINSYGVVNTLLHIFNATTVAEVTVGVNHGGQTVEPLTPDVLTRNDRTQVGLAGLPVFYPDANPLRLVPNAQFSDGGQIQNNANLGIESRYPFFGQNDIWNTSVNLTKVAGAHNLKAGLFYEWTKRPAARGTAFNGTFNFGRDTANPYDTGFPYSNAILGSVRSYTEATGHPDANSRFQNVEWFIQDNWRLARTFTVDMGIRFYRIGPTRSKGDQLAVFQPDAFDPARAPQLVQPIMTPDGRRGFDPGNGQIVPAVKIGTYATGSGDPANGVRIYDEGVLRTPAIQVAPRVGFAWDVQGDGRTAVRGGFGVFPDRFNDDIILQLVELPPLVNTPTANYTTIKDLLATPLSLSPATARYLNPDYKPQTIYNWSIGLQRDIGFKLVADAAYVGSAGRRLLQTNNLNGVPYGTSFQPSSLDPTTNQPLPSQFLRPYRGYLDILVSEFAGFSDYHALQLQLNRRYTAGLRFGVAYTLSSSKATTNGNVNPFLNIRDRNYASVGRKHNLVINYSYELPKLSDRWNSPIARIVGDNWEVSGVTSALSGATMALSYTIQGVTDLTGGAGTGVDTRVDIVGDLNLPRGERTPTRAFRTENVRMPSRDSNRIGSARGDELIGPGALNWDIAVNRNIPFGGTRRLQFRAELYNAFNSVQFSDINRSAIFNAAGDQVNPAFGEYTNTLPARRMQLTLRVQF